jgi:hypothetical protein
MSPGLVAFLTVLATAVGGAACICLAGALWRVVSRRGRIPHETGRITSETGG